MRFQRGTPYRIRLRYRTFLLSSSSASVLSINEVLRFPPSEFLQAVISIYVCSHVTPIFPIFPRSPFQSAVALDVNLLLLNGYLLLVGSFHMFIFCKKTRHKSISSHITYESLFFYGTLSFWYRVFTVFGTSVLMVFFFPGPNQLLTPSFVIFHVGVPLLTARPTVANICWLVGIGRKHEKNRSQHVTCASRFQVSRVSVWHCSNFYLIMAGVRRFGDHKDRLDQQAVPDVQSVCEQTWET